MSNSKPMTVGSRPATEYKLSMSSNPSSRRASLGFSISETGYNNMNSMAGNSSEFENNGIESGEAIDLVKEYLLPNVRSLNDSMSTLDKNLSDMNIIQENLVDFNESLGSLLYGLMCNSWCVAFPHVPANIETEISTIRNLERVQLEKKELLETINTLRNTGTQNQFAQPTLTVAQVKKHNSRIPANERMRDFSNSNSNEDDDDEADASSEASFVLNPPNELAQDYLRESKSSNNKSRARNSKLRRKSILHTIRNSIASASDLQQNRNTLPPAYLDQIISSKTQKHRQSLNLGGGATRIASNLEINEARTMSHQRLIGQVGKPPKRDSTNSESRPPFR